MGFFDQTRYIRTILIILPVGLVFIGLGVQNTLVMLNGIEGFEKVQGRVSEFYVDVAYHKSCDCTMESVFMRIDNNEELYITRVTEDIRKLQKTIEVGMIVTVWESEGYYINQLAIGQDVIVGYKPSYVFSYLFLLLGIGVTGPAVYYLFKHPEDLKG